VFFFLYNIVAPRKVTGIERSLDQIAEAKRRAAFAGEDNLVELRQGDELYLPLY
jgi:hypothetical protein